MLDVVPGAQKSREPDDQEFGSYCFEELEPAKVMETISTEVIELTDGSEDSECSQKLRKPLEKQGVIRNVNVNTDKKKMQAMNSEFQEHSQNSWTETAVETIEIKFEEKPVEK